MNALGEPELMSVEDYLQGEAVAKLRHEFVAGQVFAMAGASERHNRICFAFAEILGPHLRKHGCRGYLLSDSTERTDRTEKLFAYQQISTLRNYLLVAQELSTASRSIAAMA